MAGFFFLLAIAVIATGGWYWFTRGRAANWTEVLGSIEKGQVRCKRGISTIGVPHPASACVAEVSYSYEVESNAYAGYFRRRFLDEQKAWDFVREIEGGKVWVRYNPGNPVKSVFWRLAD